MTANKCTIETMMAQQKHNFAALKQELVATTAASTQAIKTMRAEQKQQSQLLSKLLNQREDLDGGDLPESI